MKTQFIKSPADGMVYYRTRVDRDGDLRFEISLDNENWQLLVYVDAECRNVELVKKGLIDDMEYPMEGDAE